MAKFKFDIEKRANLLVLIAKQGKLAQISKSLQVDKSTIYREIVNHVEYRITKRICNNCPNANLCLICRGKWKHHKYTFFKEQLSACERGNQLHCPLGKKFPYSCHACKNSLSCQRMKRYYDPVAANKLSKKFKSLTRHGTKCTKTQLREIGHVLKEGVENGQSLHHIYWSNFNVCGIVHEDTIRRYIYRNKFQVRAHQLPRYVRFTHKRKSALIRERNAANLRDDGRSFEDFLKISNSIKKDFGEYDSVVGKQDDKKAILTITYVEFDFQFGILIKKNNPKDVVMKIRELQNLLGERYGNIFKINLCDNGIEFDNFTDIEGNEKTGEVKSKVFYTRVYKSSDKGDCENNHSLVRRILLKHESLNFLDQKKVNLIFSHINSYIRESKENKTPYELFVERFGLEITNKLGIKCIDKTSVILKPKLVK